MDPRNRRALMVVSMFGVSARAAVGRQVPIAQPVRPSPAPRFAGAIAPLRTDPDSGRELTPREQAAQALSRLTFGPRTGDLEWVAAFGVDRWIDEQLGADTALDAATATALDAFPSWTAPFKQLDIDRSSPIRINLNTGAMMVSGSGMAVMSFGPARAAPVSNMAAAPATGATTAAALLSFPVIVGRVPDQGIAATLARAGNGLVAGRLARAEANDEQLLEVMTDFWENHFSVYGLRAGQGINLIQLDREAIRPRALGRFRDLLGAVARSPAMLTYLDNALSGADTDRLTVPEFRSAQGTGARPKGTDHAGLNENYARELLELHTLGVDGGYTQQDVVEVARAFTGWSTSSVVERAPPRVTFEFDSTQHDAEAKVVLGHQLPAGRGIEDGEDVLDMLARSPATAHFIARKLAVRFVSDSPSAALVDRAADTWIRTDGNIREVLRTIITSPEFFSRGAFKSKVKTPTEFVLSARRALDAPVDTAAEDVQLLITLGQPPFGRLSPDGWPDNGATWMNAGALLSRVQIADRIAQGNVPSIPVERWSQWSGLVTLPVEQQADGVVRALLGGEVSGATRTALYAVRPTPGDTTARSPGEDTLRQLIAIALSSPEFQRR